MFLQMRNYGDSLNYGDCKLLTYMITSEKTAVTAVFSFGTFQPPGHCVSVKLILLSEQSILFVEFPVIL